MESVEQWKPIKALPWQYEISSHGRIRSARYLRILKPNISNTGYLRLPLYHGKTDKRSVYKNYSIHKLVAEAFVGNPHGYPCVNHLDGNKLNNHATNLEWCTLSHNSKHNFRIGLQKPQKTALGKTGELCPNSKGTLQYDLSGNLIASFCSTREAAQSIGLSSTSIARVCRGERNRLGQFTFKYAPTTGAQTINQ